ncbi:MAG TPA: uroporphyrinogen-III synthase [Actinomycetota bacterium]|nr:uroporphyrinogen-III synthase [Actinomycetota bacterium]
MSARGPLAGRVVLVTRPRSQAEELVRALERRGARTILAPAVEIAPARSAALARSLSELASGGFAWIVLTSRATVDVLAGRIAPSDVRARVATVGEGTAEAFRQWAGRAPDLVPRTFTTAGLARAFPRGRGRVLCARADIAPAGLEDALAAKGWAPVRVVAYRTRMARSLPPEARRALRAGEVHAVAFTSASTVRGFLGAVREVRGAPKVVCIGPVTAREARARGLTVHAVARPHTVEGLVAALERALRPRSGRARREPARTVRRDPR